MTDTAAPHTTPPPESAQRHGVATYLGVLVTIGGALAAIVAGIEGNDTGTATGGAVTLLAALGTIGLKGAQAVAAIRAGAQVAGPWVDALQAALAATPPETAKALRSDAYALGHADAEQAHRKPKYDGPSPEVMKALGIAAQDPGRRERAERLVQENAGALAALAPNDGPGLGVTVGPLPVDLSDEDLELVDGDVRAAAMPRLADELESAPDPDLEHDPDTAASAPRGAVDPVDRQEG